MQNNAINFRLSYQRKKAAIFRSAQVDHLPEAAILKLFKDHQIECHIDLRNQNEVIQAYGQDMSMICYKRFSLADGGSKFRNLLKPGPDDYKDYYQNLILYNKQIIRDLLLYIAQTPYQKFLFSCYAGKDRTGIIIALLLLLIGLPKEYIINDYKQSSEQLLANIIFFKSNWEKKGLTQGEYSERMLAKEEIILDVLNALFPAAQSMEQFFVHYLGLNSEVLSAIKNKFL